MDVVFVDMSMLCLWTLNQIPAGDVDIGQRLWIRANGCCVRGQTVAFSEIVDVPMWIFGCGHVAY